MKKYLYFLFIGFCLLNCGGGGGGGSGSGGSGDGSGDDDATDYPDSDYTPTPDDEVIVPEPDNEPYVNGDPTTRNGNTWTIEADGSIITATSNSQIGNIYLFDEQNNGNSIYYPLAAANADVELIGLILEPQDGGEPIFAFGMQGDFNSLPQIGSGYFSGQYSSLSRTGEYRGTVEMEIFIDFNNISNSYALDMSGGDTVQIHFVEILDDAISGTISDQNHDYNLVSFGIFGNDAQTLAGGYANETGVGILIAED